ncbi:hypothetical protein A1D22_01480 [Pasteurellaceae bacterium LFhippo2]|nr:hypothetical protein [Pasteurellaceae bacterium LFhippo2]
MLIRKQISAVALNDLFYEISEELGFSDEIIDSYLPDIEQLMQLWSNQGYVEIYQFKWERKFGMAKSSDKIPPSYMDLYHARLIMDENDPLLVIKFEEQITQHPILSIRFMADHTDLFGGLQDKHYPERLRAIRKRIADFIKQGEE